VTSAAGTSPEEATNPAAGTGAQAPTKAQAPTGPGTVTNPGPAANGEGLPEALADAVTTMRELVEPELRKALSRLDPGMHRVCSYHLGWIDADGVPTLAGAGKALRPTLTLLSARACGADPAEAVPAAVAVELVHNFSLLHDDVMDGDATRRHQPTAWTVYGVPAAVLAGDALLTLALDVLARSSPPHGSSSPRASRTTGRLVALVLDAVGKLIAGQSADLEFERRADVSLSEGLAMSDAKTAALLRCSAACGAVCAGAHEHDVQLLRRFAGHLGTAFQLVDDLLGIWGTPEVTGKPTLADLRCRKKSLPVLSALQNPGPDGALLRSLYRRPEPFGEEELPVVADAIERAGGRAWAQRRAERAIDKATRCLDQLAAEPRAREALTALADYVIRRDR
jgi:geranylgeranyl diphosphate synthase type I